MEKGKSLVFRNRIEQAETITEERKSKRNKSENKLGFVVDKQKKELEEERSSTSRHVGIGKIDFS